MTRRFIGVRWWLGAAFAVVAAVSTAVVVSEFSSRSQNAFRVRAEELATSSAFGAAVQLDAIRDPQQLPTRLRAIAREQDLALRLYDRSGRLLASATPRGQGGTARDQVAAALRSALHGQRFVVSTTDGRLFVVGIPLRSPAAAVVATSARPDVAAAIGIVSDQALRAGVIAGLIGVLVGLVLAQLISLRLRRLTLAAEALARGDFETPLDYRFQDEFGALARSFERMRRQLRRSFRRIQADRDRLRLLLERLHEGVVTVDQELRVQFANAEARRLLGAPLREGDLLPEPWPALPLRELASKLFDAEASVAQEHVHPDEQQAIAVVGIPARPEAETALIVLDDLSEEERNELAAREFVTNAAHELRTPLTTIIGAVEVLQSGAKEDPAERDRFLAHIERESGRLARLARALLALARAQVRFEHPRTEVVLLRPLLEEIARDLQPHDGVVIRVECAADVAVVANHDLLEQALRNLAENAAKHTAAGSIVLRSSAADTLVRMEVEDTGRGMDAETQRHVFDRFYRGDRRSAEGFGLGLAIVQQAVQALGATIDLDSAPGRGTRFSLALQRAPASVREPTAAVS